MVETADATELGVSYGLDSNSMTRPRDVEHRDRLGRMNTELVESALAAHGRRLVVLDGGEVDDDLVRDIVEVLTSFCARLYGRRSARNRALKAVGCAQRDIGPRAVLGAKVVGGPGKDGR